MEQKLKTPDPRYTVTLEACGQTMPQYVARFCGNWIGWAESHNDAVKLCQREYERRLGKGYKVRLPSGKVVAASDDLLTRIE